VVLLSLGTAAASAQTPTPDPAPVPPPPPAPASEPASPPPPTTSTSHQAPAKARPAKKSRPKTQRAQRPAYTVPAHAPLAERGTASVQKQPLAAHSPPVRVTSGTTGLTGALIVPILALCAVAVFSIALALAPTPALGRISIHALENRGDLALGGLVVLLAVTVGILAALVGN
jgi:hypothetical protein